MTKKHLTDQRFSDLNLIDSLKKGIAETGFEYCTPIQEKSLPIALSGKDVAGQAQTGTGKTVAFLLACCQHLVNNPIEKHSINTRALILAPTRELAIQIYNDAEVLAKYTGLKLGLVYGGTGYDEQKQMLSNGADILIGTPGRLIDFYKQKLFNLKIAQVVVLDEADRMFDLGFIKDIRFLLRRMPEPESRLNMLFSATLSFRVMELAYEHMNNPQEIKIDAETRVAEKIEEYSYYPADEEKSKLLINLLRRDNPERVLVFVNTRHAADEVSRTLTANDISNAAISGDVPQRKRESLLDAFKTGKCKVLVATDVAARGLHIPQVSHVYNYDLPQDADDYVHRIGRTARAGQSGEAISFICEKYAYSIMDIESYIGHAIPKREIAAELLLPIEMPLGKATKQHRNNTSKTKSQKKPQPTKANNKYRKNFGEENQELDNTNQKSNNKRQAEPQVERPSEAIPGNLLNDTNLLSDDQFENESQIKTKNSTKADPPTKTQSESFPLSKSKFSRRFGEIPLIG